MMVSAFRRVERNHEWSRHESQDKGVDDEHGEHPSVQNVGLKTDVEHDKLDQARNIIKLAVCYSNCK